MATRREIRLPLGKLDPSAGYLLRREWLIIGRLAALTARQHDIFFKRISGWTFEEIGREAGHSKQGAQNIFRQALKKICRSEYVYPYAGLSEVYQAEIRRGRFAKRR
ncbi:MAG: hypothetical protein JNM85_08755 [Chthonomonas sp.]|nr:hypothetical protein [Chthonomonas sp.]